jgi:hypothetical protein
MCGPNGRYVYTRCTQALLRASCKRVAVGHGRCVAAYRACGRPKGPSVRILVPVVAAQHALLMVSPPSEHSHAGYT